jgi:hypothetical protein
MPRYAECHLFECYIQALYAECHYAECHYAECCCAECRSASVGLHLAQLLAVPTNIRLGWICLSVKTTTDYNFVLIITYTKVLHLVSVLESFFPSSFNLCQNRLECLYRGEEIQHVKIGAYFQSGRV